MEILKLCCSLYTYWLWISVNGDCSSEQIIHGHIKQCLYLIDMNFLVLQFEFPFQLLFLIIKLLVLIVIRGYFRLWKKTFYTFDICTELVFSFLCRICVWWHFRGTAEGPLCSFDMEAEGWICKGHIRRNGMKILHGHVHVHVVLIFHFSTSTLIWLALEEMSMLALIW